MFVVGSARRPKGSENKLDLFHFVNIAVENMVKYE